ncbi:MAG: CDP-alcohol phosphatidyltransferase family protein [Deltaproteobacteria bacterium]|nr:CDP-alcohol phosphatidyltransferase family protein [Deltaproteobacteria bacterium]
MADEKPAAHATYKPIEVEELVDVHLHRPAARALVRVIKDTPITSNQVTVLSGVFGIIAGMLIGFGDPGRLWPVALGGVALFMSVVFDCADGQLARLRGTSSLAGRALDGFIDIVPIASVFIGWALFLDHYGFNPYYSWPVATAAGLSVRWHAETYDYAKCLFLANTHPNPGARRCRRWRRSRPSGSGSSARGTAGWRSSCCSSRPTPRRSGRGSRARRGLDEPGMANAEERSLYRRLFGRAMRLWSWNGIGTHNFLLYAAAILTPVWPAAAFATFWIIILPLNALTLGLQQWGKALERRLAAELRGARGGDAA